MPAHSSDSPSREVVIELRGGHHFQLLVPEASPILSQLLQLQDGHGAAARQTQAGIFQLPLDSGRESLTFVSTDVTSLRIRSNGEHPAMNISEAHLGGYISAKHPRSLELGMEHGDSATWFPSLWRWIRRELQVGSVLDVGCGEGHAAGFFRELGCRICGVDGSQLALRDSVIPEVHLRHDYTTGPFLPENDYDLIWCCEFVEHVEEQFADNFLATFACAGKYIFMTAAPPGQPGWHHVNCQPSVYWIERIERLGFYFDPDLTEEARRQAGAGHFLHHGLVFERG